MILQRFPQIIILGMTGFRQRESMLDESRSGKLLWFPIPTEQTISANSVAQIPAKFESAIANAFAKLTPVLA